MPQPHSRTVNWMLILSEPARRILENVPSGFLFEPVNFGTSVVLAAKLPYEQIDFLWHGAVAHLAVEVIETSRGSFLWSALAVVDHEPAIFYVHRTHRPEQLQDIVAFLSQDRVEVAVFDELNRCVGSLRGQVDGTQAVLDRLTGWTGELEPDEADVETVLEARADGIDRHPDLLKQLRFRFPEERVVMHASHSDVPSPTFDDSRARAGSRFDERDVGVALEADITRIMADVFPSECLFPSPPVGAGSHARELIDVVAVAHGTLIFVEAKAVQIRPGTDLSRRESNGRKALTKAVKQLQGASRRVRQSPTLRLENSFLGREVEVSGPIYLIAVVGEFAAETMVEKPLLFPSGEASDVLCVLQLAELQTIVAAAKDPMTFLRCLDKVGQRQANHGYEHIMRRST
jgi:hypothetical protein